MSFRLVPKSVTLNDLKQRRPNGRYFALFHRTRARCRRKTSRPTWVSQSTRLLLKVLILYDHIKTICAIS